MGNEARHRPSRDWPVLAAIAAREDRFLRWSERRLPLAPALYEVVRFGMKQAPSIARLDRNDPSGGNDARKPSRNDLVSIRHSA